jgi:hypothetical protein
MTQRARRLFLAATLSVCLPLTCWGQAAWEYTPYQARLWIALEATPHLPPALAPTLGEAVASRSSAVLGAVLELATAAPPPKLRGAMRQGLAELTADVVAAAATREDLEADKIFLATVGYRGGIFAVGVRELDCKSRQLGPPMERSCATTSGLKAAVWDAMLESFTPLARIEQVEERKIVARLRAGGLAIDERSPALAQPGMVLRPVLRRNDRTGQPLKGGILPIGWTYFTVDERWGAVLECTQRSGYRSAIPPRGGVRLERLALLVRPRYDQTQLVLRSRTAPAKALVGYEVHRRVENTDQTELLGISDEQGAILLDGAVGELETLIVKSGKQLLARLPVVPGHEPTLTAYIVDDDGRLAAEGIVAALSSRALDLVARREILAARIRARLNEGKADEAQRLLDEFRRLGTRADLSRDLDRYRQQISASDKATQTRIERVFNDAQKLLLLKPLSDELLTQLTREVAAGRASGG